MRPAGGYDVQGRPEVARAGRALLERCGGPSGRKEAPLLAKGMVLTLLDRMETEVGRIAGPWLDSQLARSELRLVPRLDLFDAWARLTATEVDKARALDAVRAYFEEWKASGGADRPLDDVLRLREQAEAAGVGQAAMAEAFSGAGVVFTPV